MSYGHPIWQQAADALNNELNKNYVYVYITRNRNGISDRLHSKDIPNIKCNEERDSLDSNWSMDNSKTLLKSLRFNMLIESEDWNKISPTIISYKGRLYNTLKCDW